MVFGLMGVVGADLSGLMYTDGARVEWEVFRLGLGAAEELKQNINAHSDMYGNICNKLALLLYIVGH